MAFAPTQKTKESQMIPDPLDRNLHDPVETEVNFQPAESLFLHETKPIKALWLVENSYCDGFDTKSSNVERIAPFMEFDQSLWFIVWQPNGKIRYRVPAHLVVAVQYDDQYFGDTFSTNVELN
jgi:hypothetical protein